jgi:hypothetical protein
VGRGTYCSLSCAKRGQRIRPPAECFWSRVDKTPGFGPNGDCWRYTGGLCSGYGHITIQKKTVKAHRFSYELHCGPIPEGMVICHKCDTPACVNPDNLFIGTPRQNIDDMLAKDRQLKGTDNPKAKLTDEQVREMRYRRDHDKTPTRQLATDYGIAEVTVKRVISRRAWSHIA